MMKEGSIASGISTESDIGLNNTRYGTREVHTRSVKRINLGNKNVKRVRLQSCGTLGYGPTLNKKGVDIKCDQVARYDKKQLINYVGNNISAKARDEENHFPAR